MKKLNKIYSIICICCLTINTIPAQSYEWAKNMGQIITHGHSIAVDNSGNVYTTGYFNGSVDFDPGAGISTLTSAGDWDVFISKLDASGNFVWATKMLKGKSIKKIAGFDLFQHLMHNLNTSNGSCFFLGASQSTLDAIKEKAAIDFPNVTVHSYSPPYKPVFSEAESKQMCEQVNAIKPDVLFVGMTAPKQEKWVHQFKNNLDANIICSIGAVFDFYAGNVKRPSQFWISLGLEWLPRLLKEPRRLFYRNFISTPKFILEVLSFKFFKRGIL